MTIRVALALIAAALLPHVTFSQSGSRDKVTQGIEWFSLSNNIKVGKHLSIIAEGQFRFANELEPMQFQFRTAADIHITKNLSVVPLGYVYTWNPMYGKQPNKFVNNEHRLWQQALFKHDIGKVHFSHRGRLEQRYIQVHRISNGEVIYEGFDYFANRFRYRLMLSIPLTKKVSASFYNEVFASWGPKVTYHKPDQNRVFAGVGYQLTKDLTITSGFLYQMLVKANGAMQENNLGLQVSVGYNIDLTN